MCLTILPVPTQKDLKSTKVGKLVNKIAKNSRSNSAQSQTAQIIISKAYEVVNKWKKELNRMKTSEFEDAAEKQRAQTRSGQKDDRQNKESDQGRDSRKIASNINIEQQQLDSRVSKSTNLLSELKADSHSDSHNSNTSNGSSKRILKAQHKNISVPSSIL